MSAAELQVIREHLGLPESWFAAYLGVSEGDVVFWQIGHSVIPEDIATQVSMLADEATALVAEIASDLAKEPQPVLTTYLHDDDYRSIDPGGTMPASWHRSIAARVADRVPRLRIRFATGSELPALKGPLGDPTDRELQEIVEEPEWQMREVIQQTTLGRGWPGQS
ncbi:transcriptional regulator [Catenulispora sp. GAS73]|uniref:transcriptional regulator n=1 Tax=Catenulispora sp. GAS73 TaxID=3156269 RepID=UPI003517AAD3